MRKDYEVRLAAFEGPLDLLLHLVRSAKMEISEIRLADITDQYLEYMSQVNEIDMDRASDFLETASILLLIKSRALLPVPEEQEADEPDPEQELLTRMQLYEVFRSAAGSLRNKERSASDYFYRRPEEKITDEAEARLLDADADKLRSAYMQLFLQVPREPKRPDPLDHIVPETYSVRRMKQRLLLRLRAGGFAFYELFGPAPPRLEVAAAFIALLELWGARLLRVKQKRPFAAVEVLPGLEQL